MSTENINSTCDEGAHWGNPGKCFDLCTASPLQSASVSADERQEGDFKTWVFGQSLQLHVRKVILTTGICCICTLSLLPVLIQLPKY